MSNIKKVNMYTDGAAQGNPGPGGYGVILESGDQMKELSAGYEHTTNNRMELLAVIKGLEALKRENLEVHIYTDSRYVADAVTKGWLFNWERKGFAKQKNTDLWKRFLELYPRQKLHFHWIRGHNGHPQNERCDELAVAAARSGNLFRDEGYTP